MNILVCIKQVPGSTNVEVDPVTGVLKRDGVKSKMNPYDLHAIELALSLCEKYKASVKTITMGPPMAKEVIEESVCMGAECGTVLSDRRFAGADVLATAYTISQGILNMGEFDLIICGKQTTDGDTAQVGAEVAEYLKIPNVSNVTEVKYIKDGEIFLTSVIDNKIMEMAVKLPCLISTETDINSPRLPSYKIKKTLNETHVKFVSMDDFADQNANNYGLNGSATQVERIFPPEKNQEKTEITGSDQEKAIKLYNLVLKQKLI